MLNRLEAKNPDKYYDGLKYADTTLTLKLIEMEREYSVLFCKVLMGNSESLEQDISQMICLQNQIDLYKQCLNGVKGNKARFEEKEAILDMTPRTRAS